MILAGKRCIWEQWIEVSLYTCLDKSQVYMQWHIHSQHDSCVCSFLEFSVRNVLFSTSLHIAILLLSVSNWHMYFLAASSPFSAS
jgi:hypothetical protein